MGAVLRREYRSASGSQLPVIRLDRQSRASRIVESGPGDHRFFGQQPQGSQGGAEVAQQAQSEFHLLHVIEELDEELIKRSPHGSPMRKDINDNARQRLESFVRLLETDPSWVHLHLSLGTAWQEIARTAQHLGADLVVIGTLGRTGVSRLLLGNTAERVLETCDSSILTVKPDGFVSPVDPTFRVLHPE